MTNPQNDMLWHVACSLPLTFDLAVKFIVSERPAGFLICDDPVIAYNQFAEHHPRFKHLPGATGLALKGLQLFLPLSPTVTLAVYDPTTYSYGGHGNVCRAGPQDVVLLNRMQGVNAMSCLYFAPDRTDDESIASAQRARAEHRPMREGIVEFGRLQSKGGGDLSQLVITKRVQLRVGAKLSFIRVNDAKPYDNWHRAMLPVRSEALVQVSEEYAELLNAKVEEARRQAAGSS